MRNLHRAGFTLIELFICFCALLSIGGVIALICVGFHFLAKWW